MRILFVTQYFPPETGAAPARAVHLAAGMRRAGHEVVVLTGMPNHPSGRVQPGYRGALHRRETVDGAVVERVWLCATPKKRALTRLLNHVTFAITAFLRMLALGRFDVVVVTAPPPFIARAACTFARLRHTRLVVDLRDDWPRAAIALGQMREGFAARVLGALMDGVIARSSAVIAVTPGMKRQLVARNVPEWKVALIPNGSDVTLFGPEETPRRVVPRTVLYAGTHGLVHGMDAILDAAALLRDQDVRFVLLGDGVEKERLVRRAEELRLDNVEFLPSVSPAEVAKAVRDSGVCLVTTRADEFCGETLPVKVLDYLAAGRAVVAAVRGDAADVVAASGGGVVVQPQNGMAMAEAIAGVLNDPVQRERFEAAGPPFIRANYSRQVLSDGFTAVVEGVAPRADAGSGYRTLKAMLDVVLAAIALVLLSPVFAVCALAIKIDSRGPVMFRQWRIGANTTHFSIYKFRTMTVDTPDVATSELKDRNKSVTRVGRFLRRYSLDELPQLINVVRGEMSWIGPRPALYNQEELIEMRREAGIDALLPGLTGWAQVNGRDKLTLAEKVGFDTYYLENLSAGLDAQIVLRTFAVLVSAEGAF